ARHVRVPAAARRAHDAHVLAAAALLRGAPAAVPAQPRLRVSGGRGAAAAGPARAARSRAGAGDVRVLCLVHVPLHAGRLRPGTPAHDEQARSPGVLLSGVAAVMLAATSIYSAVTL